MTAQQTEAASSTAGDTGAPSREGVLGEAVASLQSAVSALTSGVQARSTGWVRLAAAAREVEVRARHLANLLEDRGGGLPPRLKELTDPSARSALSHPFSVLVVDDDADDLEFVRRVLEPWFVVRTARSGAEAAELLREDPPDVVVTDLYMPNAGGLALLELARTREDAAHTPLLVLSGRADTEAKVLAFESGAFDFVTKPVAPGELIARVRNALAHSQVLRRERVLGGRDDLTGLANRRTFRSFLDRALSSARTSGEPLAVVLVDQDRLKHINDTWGHLAGDDALKILAHALASSTRGSDCAARVGGDEFALVIPGCDREGATRLLARVEEALRRDALQLPDGTEIFVEASFGLACLGEEDPDESAEALLRRADVDLYQHKRSRQEAARAISGGSDRRSQAPAPGPLTSAAR